MLINILSASSRADHQGREPQCHVAERNWCCQALLAEACARSLPILRLAARWHPASMAPQQEYGWEVQQRVDVDPRHWTPVHSGNNGGAGVL